MTQQLREGEGWRLGWNPDAEVFRGLVGGENWALELTEAELEDFCRLIVQLADTLRQISSELMDGERVSCEVESDQLWLEAEGFPQAYTLRLLLLKGRGAEGAWGESAVPELIQAVQMLKVF
ncbi:MAG: DUF1818 family protein [Leptolyngbyaceae cyanobacterium CRU_2_3]|nr:DUF1818 family protein [Leptolyngbyaceae cyanobacterium CRU_2_3]